MIRRLASTALAVLLTAPLLFAATERKDEKKKEERKAKKKKNNALVLCQDGKSYWTTQKQFWQWFRDRIIVKEGDYPLRGRFTDSHHEKMVVIGTTVLNLACPNHLQEALYARRYRAYWSICCLKLFVS